MELGIWDSEFGLVSGSGFGCKVGVFSGEIIVAFSMFFVGNFVLSLFVMWAVGKGFGGLVHGEQCRIIVAFKLVVSGES